MKRVPFSNDEFQVIGEYASSWAGRPGTPKYNTPVTPRENYIAMMKGQKPLWIPMSADVVTILPKALPDNIARSPIEDPATHDPRDMFGVEWIFVDVAGGATVKPGNPMLLDANDWPDVIKFPDVDSWDWEKCAADNKDILDGGRVRCASIVSGLFERLISWMDFEGAASALIDEDQKDAVHALLSRLCQTWEEIIDKYEEYFQIDLLEFHDDWGAQRAPFFSLDTVMEMLVPYLKRVVSYAHSKGIFVNMHSCGKNEMLVPAMIAAGVDTWNGQVMNDKDMLYEQYGDKITLGVSPEIPPMDADDETVYAAAKEFVDKYAPNFPEKRVIAGFFMAPPKMRDYIYQLSREALDK